MRGTVRSPRRALLGLALSAAVAASLPSPAHGAELVLVFSKDCVDGRRAEDKRGRLALLVAQGDAFVVSRHFTAHFGGGGCGDKRAQGDRLTPEGYYHTQAVHGPHHLSTLEFRKYGRYSITTDYPNREDRRRGRGGANISIHGGTSDSSLGCIRVVDDDGKPRLDERGRKNVNSTAIESLAAIVRAQPRSEVTLFSLHAADHGCFPRAGALVSARCATALRTLLAAGFAPQVEVERLLGDDGARSAVAPPLPAGAWASSVDEDGDAGALPAHAFDGSLPTAWCSRPPARAGAWYSFYLAAPVALRRIDLAAGRWSDTGPDEGVPLAVEAWIGDRVVPCRASASLVRCELDDFVGAQVLLRFPSGSSRPVCISELSLATADP